MRARTISAKMLRADCTTLERAVLSARLTTKESLVPHRPGGESNPQRDAFGWLAYYRHLHRLHARAESAPSSMSRSAADAAALDALRSEPIAVHLVDSKPGDPPILVYSKSLDALLQVHALDRQ